MSDGFLNIQELQDIIDYEASLADLNVKYVDARRTSSLCPICGERLSPNGYRLMRCQGCGLEEDRDMVAVGEPATQVPDGCGGFTRSPRKPSHDMRREDLAMEAKARPERLLV
jgi:putative transposase